MKFKVMIKNFITNQWEVLKLRYDPRTGGEGLAEYDTRQEAQFCKDITLSIALQGSIKLKIIRA